MQKPWKQLSINQFQTYIYRALLIFVNALILSGCASNAPKVSLSEIDAPPSEKAKIVVIRPGQMLGWAVNLQVIANSKTIAILPNSSYTNFLMPPGKLTLVGDKEENSSSILPRIELSFDVEGGKTYYIAWLTKYSGAGILNPLLVVAIGRSSIHWALLTIEDAQKIIGNASYIPTAIAQPPSVQ